MVRQLAARDLLPGGHTKENGRPEALVESYRRLAEVYHQVLSAQSLDTLLDRIADTLSDLIPYDTLSIFQADEAQTVLLPVLARDRWAEEIMRNRIAFGAGLAAVTIVMTGCAEAPQKPQARTYYSPAVRATPSTLTAEASGQTQNGSAYANSGLMLRKSSTSSSQAYYYVLDDLKVPVSPDERDLETVTEVVLEVGEGILAQAFAPTPSPAACSMCDYRIVCPAAEA